MAHSKRGKAAIKRARVKGYNKPKRTPGHPKKSHIVVAKVGHKVKTIRFGQQGSKTAGKPKAGKTIPRSLLKRRIELGRKKKKKSPAKKKSTRAKKKTTKRRY